MSRSAVDPALVHFVEQVGEGAGSIADSVAGLLLRLLARVASLEKTTQAQASKLDALTQPPKPKRAKTHDAATVIKSGIDAFGDPVRLEERIRRPRGRPAGSRDSYQRHRPPRSPHNLEAELTTYVDPDWDQMGG
jgi:hypothetical protein